MCNAWNHPASCNCGWGNNRTKSSSPSAQGSLFLSWPQNITPIDGSLTSLTIPNVSCPVCGNPVFYYCNSFGSSVFFDELGPPWPKHPCTDNKTDCLPRSPASRTIEARASWQNTGWELYNLSHIKNLGNGTIHLKLLSPITNEELSLITKPEQEQKEIENILNIEKLGIFVKNIGNNNFRISALKQNLKPTSFTAQSLTKK